MIDCAWRRRPRHRRNPPYLDDVDDLLPKNSSARDFFNAMLQRYPNRRLGATTLWAGTRNLYALRDRRGGEVLHESLAGWL